MYATFHIYYKIKNLCVHKWIMHKELKDKFVLKCEKCGNIKTVHLK